MTRLCAYCHASHESDALPSECPMCHKVLREGISVASTLAQLARCASQTGRHMTVDLFVVEGTGLVGILVEADSHPLLGEYVRGDGAELTAADAAIIDKLGAP